MKQVIEQFNEIDEIVYVADLETYELLFLNDAGFRALPYKDFSEIEKRPCYEVLQGRTQPCEFCTNHKLCKQKSLEWKFTNSITGQTYLLKDKLVDWDGKPARMEIAINITEYNNEKARLEKLLDNEYMIMECIRAMHSSVDTELAINNSLAVMGRFLQSERSYVYEFHGNVVSNTHEWHEDGKESVMNLQQNIPRAYFSRWLEIFQTRDAIVIRDLEEIKESDPVRYERLKKQNISSVIAIPITVGDETIGFFGVNNPKSDNLDYISHMLKVLAYFFQSLLERKKSEKYLKRLSFIDGLTGAFNRNAYIKKITMDMKQKLTSIGVIYIDINGLKQINDTQGHEAGDRLIIRIYNIVQQTVEKFPVYRIGGDEFVVVCEDIKRQDFDTYIKKLKKELSGRNRCSAAIGSRWTKELENLDMLIEEADQRMYEDKRIYYQKLGT